VSPGAFDPRLFQANAFHVSQVKLAGLDIEFADLAQSVGAM
jgi:hypothetical protein